MCVCVYLCVYIGVYVCVCGFPGGSVVKNRPANAEDADKIHAHTHTHTLMPKIDSHHVNNYTQHFIGNKITAL